MFQLITFEELRNGEERTQTFELNETRLEVEIGRLIRKLNHASLDIRGNSIQWEDQLPTGTGGKIFLRNVWRWKKMI
jgi:hypothetical protein